jgi:hypothetical protein
MNCGVQVRKQTATLRNGTIVTWDPVTPVISFEVSLVTDSFPAPQHGHTVTLVVTFVKEGAGGVRSVTEVTGFSSTDIIITVSTSSDSSQALPTLVEVSPVAPTSHKVEIQADKEMWPSSILTGCTAVTLTLEVQGIVEAAVLLYHNILFCGSNLCLSRCCEQKLYQHGEITLSHSKNEHGRVLDLTCMPSEPFNIKRKVLVTCRRGCLYSRRQPNTGIWRLYVGMDSWR